MNSEHSSAAVTDDSAALELALEQSQDVKAKVEECANDVGEANVVIKGRMADGATTLSASKTLAIGSQLESKVQECADDLLEVTESLTTAVVDLRTTKAELKAAKQALAKSQSDLAVSQEGEKKAKLEALYDSTTGLPNRALFDTRLEQAVSMVARHGGTLAVMFLDLDGFKSVNDLHGHAAGDAVLLEVASRLSEHARAEDTVCRNGGDEFLYLLVNPQGTHNIERIAQSVYCRLAQDIGWPDATLRIRASIGISRYPGDGRSADELIRRADAAMYRAKKSRLGFSFSTAADDFSDAP